MRKEFQINKEKNTELKMREERMRERERERKREKRGERKSEWEEWERMFETNNVQDIAFLFTNFGSCRPVYLYVQYSGRLPG